MKKFLAIVLALVMVLSLASCGSKQETTTAPVANEKKLDVYYNLASAATTGTFFAEGTVFEKLSDQIDGVTIYNQATNGSGENLTLLADNSVQLALMHNTTALPAYNGEGQYAGNKMDNFNAVGFIWYNAVHIIADKSDNIDKVEDLKGKVVSVGTTGSAVELCSKYVLDSFGMGFDDIKLQRLSAGDEVDGVKNHQLDAFFHPTSIGDSNVIDVMSTGNAKIVSLSDEAIDTICKKYNMFSPAVIPAGTYPNQDYDVKTASAACMIYCRPDCDEEAIYRFTKAVYENYDFLVTGHKSLFNCKIENAIDGAGNVPIHPGAARYYKEVGLMK